MRLPRRGPDNWQDLAIEQLEDLPAVPRITSTAVPHAARQTVHRNIVTVPLPVLLQEPTSAVVIAVPEA